MAIQVDEKLSGTRGGSIDAKSGTRTLVKHYIVHEDTYADITLQQAIAAMDAEVPLFSTEDIGTVFISGSTQSVQGTYYGTKSWTTVEGLNNAYEFQLTFSNAPDAGQAVPDDNNTGGEIEWITTQGDINGTTKAIWRANPEMDDPDDPQPSMDIGGEKVDSGGTPTSITWVDWRFTTTQKYTDFPPLNTWATLIGTRNQSGYEGAGIGEVLYLGFSWAKDGSSGLWSVTHNFAVDKETLHMEQVAKCDPDGKVIIEKGTEQGDEDNFHASFVYFIQPFPRANWASLPNF